MKCTIFCLVIALKHGLPIPNAIIPACEILNNNQLNNPGYYVSCRGLVGQYYNWYKHLLSIQAFHWICCRKIIYHLNHPEKNHLSTYEKIAIFFLFYAGKLLCNE